MTYKQFTEKWLSRYLDFDGMFGFQCVDVMRQFTKDVDGFSPYIAIPTRGHAKDIFNNFKTNQYYRKVLNTPTGVPKQGNIVFWKTSTWFPFIYGISGHVAIIDTANIKEMIVFEQNYPTGKPCKFRKCGYKDCLGWLQKI